MMSQKLDFYFEDFINFLKTERNISDATVISYTTDFRQFLNFLSDSGIQPKLSFMSTPVLRRYFAYLKVDRNYSVNTIRRRIHSLSSYFKFLQEQQYIVSNPMLPIHAPKAPDILPKYLNTDEMNLLLQMPEKYSEPWYGHRNYVIILTLLMTGIRRSELLSLNWEDIDFGQQTLTVKHAKCNKQRVVPITEPLISELWKYLQSRLPLNNNAVFISDRGNRLSSRPLSQEIQRYMHILGLDKKGYTLHTLRHTFASHLAMNGASILSIQKLLGHSDLNSTQVYAHVNTEHLKSEVAKFPLSK